MSDNITVTPGSGAIIAADEAGGALYQRVKIGVGVENVVPTDLAFGAAAAASSLPVTQSTEDVARIGSLTETAPTSDTAPSGLNGRLQRVAQKLTATNAGIGAVSDAAWTSGDGSVISVLKSLASDTTAADVNLTKINGAAISLTNALPTRKMGATKKWLGVFRNKTSIRDGAAVIDTMVLSNMDTAGGVLQIFDVTAANSTTAARPGTDNPDWEFDLAAGQRLIMSNLNIPIANGMIFVVTKVSKGSTVADTGFNISFTYA